MGEGKRRAAARARAVPYPAPKSNRCQELMLGVIRGLGQLPKNDSEIEDRVLACLLVAWGELAAMEDTKWRDDIIASQSGLGRRVVGKLLAASRETTAQAEASGQSLVDLLYDAVGKGEAEEIPLPKAPRSRH
jgi:hypothetical protein